MKKLFINANVINVFSGKIIKENILVENETIISVGDIHPNDVDEIIDVKENYVCPGFIDGHIHIESTMLTPYEFAKAVLPCGTTAVMADPHEIANVCGVDGIKYMLEASEGLPLDVYIMLPSCVPATGFDESYEEIDAEKLKPLFNMNKRVLGLAEMMNYPGVLFGDEKVLAKLKLAKEMNKLIDGHAPMLTGEALDKYISYGINSDHECSTYKEAIERIEKGQWLMIRRGTAAKNLHDLLDLFNGPEANRCLLVTDDKEPSDILKKGHIDSIINKSVRKGKNVITGIQMATINAAHCFKLENVGAIAPGYVADIVILDDLQKVHVKDVYKNGKLVVKDHKTIEFDEPVVDKALQEKVIHSMNCDPINKKDLYIEPLSSKCNVIGAQAYGLVTQKLVMDMNFDKNNGIDLERDILKLAVIERHKKTGHIGLGFIHGIGLKEGAIASTVSHDSHNIIVIGTNDDDMVLAVNHIREMGGGNVIVNNGKVIQEMSLPIAGLMSNDSCENLAKVCEETRNYVHELGVPENIAPFMNMAFVSLPVIPSLKLTTLGLVDVDNFKMIPLFV